MRPFHRGDKQGATEGDSEDPQFTHFAPLPPFLLQEHPVFFRASESQKQGITSSTKCTTALLSLFQLHLKTTACPTKEKTNQEVITNNSIVLGRTEQACDPRPQESEADK